MKEIRIPENNRFASPGTSKKCPTVTAPHVIEPRYPAAVGRYVNLGQFYDVAAIKCSRKDVIHYTNAVSAAYQRAYRALGAAR